MSSPYPRIRLAILYVEEILCVKPDEPGETAWQLLMSTSWSPKRVRDVIVEQFEAPEGSNPAKVAEMRAQMDLPEFQTYIAGKMGAM